METYRVINRELSINNQELRNALNKLKHEVTYLNRQLLEQREQFIRLKESVANTIEKKYIETMALIYPERIKETNSSSRMNIGAHRRSCNNVTSADTLKNRMLSPPAGSPQKDLMIDTNLKTPVPKIIIHRDKRISISPQNSRRNMSNPSISQNTSTTSNHSKNISSKFLQNNSSNVLSSPNHNKTSLISSSKDTSSLSPKISSPNASTRNQWLDTSSNYSKNIWNVTSQKNTDNVSHNSTSQSTIEHHSQSMLSNNSHSTSSSTFPNTHLSNSQNTSDLQLSKEWTEEKNNSARLELSLSLTNSLHTINEEDSSECDTRNGTITDSTIHNLLDAPCSTPYNANKTENNNSTITKEMRVLVHKLSVNKIEKLRSSSFSNHSFQYNTKEHSNSDLSISKDRGSLLKDSDFSITRSIRIPLRKVNTFERRTSELNSKEYNSPNFSSEQDSLLTDPDYTISRRGRKPSKKNAKKNKNVVKKTTSTKKYKICSKENNESESDFTCSDDENALCRRPKRRIAGSLKEPSLRQKLRQP